LGGLGILRVLGALLGGAGWNSGGDLGEVDCGFGGGGRGFFGELDGGLVLGAEGRQGVDLDSAVADDGDAHAVGGEGEVLAGAGGGGAFDVEEGLAGVVLDDVDAFGEDHGGIERVDTDDGGVDDEASEGEASGDGGEDEGWRDVGAAENLLPGGVTAEIEGGDGLARGSAVTAEDEELTWADEEGDGAAGGVEEGEFEALAGVGLEVKGPAIVSFVEDVEEAFGGEGKVDCTAGDGHSGGARNEPSGRVGEAEAIEVELNGARGPGVGGAKSSGKAGVGVDEGKRIGAFDGEEVGLGREDDSDDVASGAEERVLEERLAGGEVGEGREGGEGVAQAEEELSVAEVPEVLAVIVDEHLGAGEEAAGGQLQEQEIDVVILIGGGVVGDAGDEAAGVEGDEEVSGIHIMQGEHGAAVEEITRGQRHEAYVFKRDSGGGPGASGEECRGQDEAEESEQQKQRAAKISGRMAAGVVERR
jgi:hypothetical protein